MRTLAICSRWIGAIPAAKAFWKNQNQWASHHFFHATPLSAGNKKIGNAWKARRARLTQPTETKEDTETVTVNKSKNQRKREAARAFVWAMEISEFTPQQIRRIARVASLGSDFVDAVMLVKRLGPDVREGKRRQFNYIGKLLRDEPPQLIEELIQATKHGDIDKIHELAGNESDIFMYVDDDSEDKEVDEEVLPVCMENAKRWTAGLISNDMSITDEVYSIYKVDFDRQELSRLVRHAQKELKNKGDTVGAQARNSLEAFLFKIAKRNYIEAD